MTAHKLLDQLKRKSFMVQGQRVVSDEAVAAIYDVTPAKLRSAVKRNIKRFPADLLVIQDSRYLFTEAGVLMISSLIHNGQAASVSVSVIRELYSHRSN
jgi:hypothetical protein